MGRHVLPLMVTAVLLAAPALVQAQQPYGDKEHAELAKTMSAANVSLEQGLAASTSAGTPISAKFEVEDGTFQLSVYTMTSGKPSEVIVDHRTGKVAKAEPITGGDDLAKAQEQGAAMGKATRSLQAAVTSAVTANPGFKATSVYPSLKGGHPVADVTLLKGTEWKAVSEKLD